MNRYKLISVKVMHSQRLNDSASHVWILAKLDGKVVCAHCTCVAGLSETCSHVGAICFAIHKISESKETVIESKVAFTMLILSFLEICNRYVVQVECPKI